VRKSVRAKSKSVRAKSKSVRAKSKSGLSCWGLWNHGKVYLRQFRVGLVVYLLHHRRYHHHLLLANSRLCQNTKRISCNDYRVKRTNCRIRSGLDSCNKHPRIRLHNKFFCKMVLWLLDPKEKNWSRTIRSCMEWKEEEMIFIKNNPHLLIKVLNEKWFELFYDI